MCQNLALERKHNEHFKHDKIMYKTQNFECAKWPLKSPKNSSKIVINGSKICPKQLRKYRKRPKMAPKISQVNPNFPKIHQSMVKTASKWLKNGSKSQ